jgi:hypothetical protein
VRSSCKNTERCFQSGAEGGDQGAITPIVGTFFRRLRLGGERGREEAEDKGDEEPDGVARHSGVLKHAGQTGPTPP